MSKENEGAWKESLLAWKSNPDGALGDRVKRKQLRPLKIVPVN